MPEDIATQQYDNLRRRNVELVLGRLPMTMSEPDLVGEPLFDEPNVVAAGSESCWAKRRNLTLADLMGEPWVLAQPGSLARSLQDAAFRKSGFEPPSATATVLTVSLHLYMRLIETGRWLGLVPASVMHFGGKQMRIKALPVKISPPPAPVGFITVKDRTLTPLAERFIDCARKIAKSEFRSRIDATPVMSASGPKADAPVGDGRGGFSEYSRTAIQCSPRQFMTLSDRLLRNFAATQHALACRRRVHLTSAKSVSPAKRIFVFNALALCVLRHGRLRPCMVRSGQ